MQNKNNYDLIQLLYAISGCFVHSLILLTVFIAMIVYAPGRGENSVSYSDLVSHLIGEAAG